MKVGLCTQYIDGEFTGVGVTVKRLAGALLDLEDAPELHLVHMRRGGDPLYARAAGEHVFTTPARVVWWRSQDRFCRRLSRDLDVIHEPFMGLPSEMACPQVLSFHDVVPLTNPELSGRMFGVYFKRIMPRVLRSADAVICNSGTTRKDLLHHYEVDPEKVHVVYHGLDVPRFERGDEFRGMEPYVVAMSHTRMKNVGFTVSEFARYKEEHGGDLRLVVVGKDFSCLAADRSDVVVTGYLERDRLLGLMAGAEAFLFPSLYEGFGYPPLEAMALGVPTVVSDRGSLPEVTGDASLVVDIDRMGSLAEAIHRLRSEEGLVDDLRRRGLERSGMFTWERAARGTLEVYRGLVG